MLTQNHVVDLKRRDKLAQPVKAFGIVFGFESEQYPDIISVFPLQCANTRYIILELPGAHTKVTVVTVRLEKLRTVVGKTEHPEPCSDRSLHIFPVLAFGVIAAVGVSV